MSANPNLLLLTKVINLLPDVVTIVDGEGKFVFVSNASEQVFGWRPRELVGKSLSQFVYAGDKESPQDIAVKDILDLIPTDNESRFVRKDGQSIYVSWVTEALEDGLWLVIARDIT